MSLIDSYSYVVSDVNFLLDLYFIKSQYDKSLLVRFHSLLSDRQRETLANFIEQYGCASDVEKYFDLRRLF